jgi:hypothetical protein
MVVQYIDDGAPRGHPILEHYHIFEEQSGTAPGSTHSRDCVMDHPDDDDDDGGTHTDGQVL